MTRDQATSGGEIPGLTTQLCGSANALALAAVPDGVAEAGGDPQDGGGAQAAVAGAPAVAPPGGGRPGPLRRCRRV